MQRVKNDTHRVHTSGMSLIYHFKKITFQKQVLINGVENRI